MRTSTLLWPLAILIGASEVLARPAPGNGPYSDFKTTTTPHKISTSKASTAAPHHKTSATTKASTTKAKTTGSASTTTASTAASGIAVSAPASKPSNAVLVPRNFVGFGFETAFLNDYTVGTFSENLINSVAKRLDHTITIRIGGTSGDQVLFDPNQSEVKVCISGDCPIGSSATYILGPSYFDGFSRFQNQHFGFQAPLGPKVNVSGSLDYVKRAYQATGADRVAAIALGNEVDIYGGGYTVSDYVTAATNLEKSIDEALSLGGQRIFGVLNLASGDSGSGFTFQAAFSDGIDSNGQTKFASQHWYQSPTDLASYGPAELQEYLMSHNAVVNKFNTGYSANLQYVQANDPSVAYIISEAGSALNGPPENYQDAFGAALWWVEFNLYCMSQGVARVDATQRPAAPHSFWVPDSSAGSTNPGPQVRGPYFGIPYLGDFVGTSSGNVVNLLAQDHFTAYGLYDPSSGALSRVALVNLLYWSSDTGGNRPTQVYHLNVGRGTSQVTVKRLVSEDGAHAGGYDQDGTTITWAGETWSYSQDNGNGHLVSGVLQSDTVKVVNGVASISVPATEAVIVYLS